MLKIATCAWCGAPECRRGTVGCWTDESCLRHEADNLRMRAAAMWMFGFPVSAICELCAKLFEIKNKYDIIRLFSPTSITSLLPNPVETVPQEHDAQLEKQSLKRIEVHIQTEQKRCTAEFSCMVML